MQDNTMMQHNDTMMNPSLETSHAGGSHMHAGELCLDHTSQVKEWSQLSEPMRPAQ